MLDHDNEGRFRMAALQSPAGRTLLESCGRRPDDISSIVLVEPDQHYTKSCARAPTRCHCILSQPRCLQLSCWQSCLGSPEPNLSACAMLQGCCSAHCQGAGVADAGAQRGSAASAAVDQRYFL